MLRGNVRRNRRTTTSESTMPDAAPSAAIELKVSAHLMMLSEGVFCVFHAPGTAAEPSATGMPGVRISQAPASPAGSGTVAITGFNGDGWLGARDVAALIQVSGGPAPVLVTVYQDRDTDQAAPKLQVIRLSDMPAASIPAEATPEPAAAEAPASGPIEVAAHIYGRGDVGGALGAWMGEPGSGRWIEGFGLAPSAGIAATDVEYQAVLGKGWLSPWSEGGQFCGSRGMSLPILGLRVRLRGEAAARYDVSLEGSFVDGSKAGPVGSGEACEAPTLSPLEAFRVAFSERAAALKPASKAVAPRSQPASVQTAPAKPASAKRAAKPDPAPAPTPAPPAKPAKRAPATTRRR